MAVFSGPKIVNDGLVLCLDAVNMNSYKNYNLATYSQDFANVVWSKSTGLITATGLLAPDGTLTATTMTDDDSAGYELFSRSFTVANNSASYNISIFIRKTTGGTSTRTGFNVNFTGGTQKSYNIRFNADTGVATGGDSRLVTSENNNYWRLSFVVSNNSTGNTNMSVSYYPATGPYDSGDINTATGSHTVWGSQVTFGSSLLPYRLNIADSATTWSDVSGNGNNGTLVNGVGYNSSNLGSLVFDGVDDHTDFFAPNLGTTTTVEMWVNLGAAYANKMFFGWLRYDVYTPSGHIGYNTANGDCYGINATTVTALGLVNNWAHYVFEMRSDVSYTNNKIYINSTQQTLSQILGTETTGNRIFNSGNGRIGGWRNDLSYKMVMNCAKFNVYNRSLSQSEILQNFNAKRSRYGI